jgi:hypothetical protein
VASTQEIYATAAETERIRLQGAIWQCSARGDALRAKADTLDAEREQASALLSDLDAEFPPA